MPTVVLGSFAADSSSGSDDMSGGLDSFEVLIVKPWLEFGLELAGEDELSGRIGLV